MIMQFMFFVSLVFMAGEARKFPTIIGTRPLYIRVRNIKLCDDNPSDTSAENITLTYEGYKIIINAVAILNRDVERVEKVLAIMRQCKDSAEEKNCEYYQTWRFGREACIMAEQKNMIWTPMFDASHPRIKCPLRKGIYHLNNATTDSTLYRQIFLGIPLEKYFWRTRLELHDKKMFGCLDYGVNFIPGKG